MNKDLNKKLTEMLAQIELGVSPKNKPIKLTRKRPSNPKNGASIDPVKKLAAAMDDLRVSVKYLLFDLEATKRENDYLKNRLSDCS